MNVIVIIPAAGTGSRMGGPLPKVFLKLQGKTILAHSLTAVRAGLAEASIVVAGRAEYRGLYEQAGKEAGVDFDFVVGGVTRQESVRFSLQHISQKIASQACDIENTVVLIHDAARCLASPDLFRTAIAAAVQHGAVTAAVSNIDTLVLVDEKGFAKSNIKRDQVWSVQTPQAFRYPLLYKAHQDIEEQATDDASLVAKFHPVKIVEGDRRNIKVTTPSDMVLAESILAN